MNAVKFISFASVSVVCVLFSIFTAIFLKSNVNERIRYLVLVLVFYFVSLFIQVYFIYYIKSQIVLSWVLFHFFLLRVSVSVGVGVYTCVLMNVCVFVFIW